MSEHLHRWCELPIDKPIAKLERRRVVGEQAMLSHITLRAGCEVPHHSHENEQFAVVLSGHIRFQLGATSENRVVDVRGGEVLHLPSNLPHSAVAIEETIVLDVFSPPSIQTGIDEG